MTTTTSKPESVPCPRVLVYFDVQKVEVKGELIRMSKTQVKIKTAAGHVFTRRLDQIRSFPRR